MKQHSESYYSIIYLLLSLIFIISGIICYLLFNPDSTITEFISRYVFIETIHFKSKLIEIIINSFASDFLWSVSFTLAIQSVLNLSEEKLFYLLFCSFLGFFFELLQLLNIAKGVFDIFDILIYLIGAFTATEIIKFIRRFI